MKLRPCAAKPKTLSVQAKNALCSSQKRSLLNLANTRLTLRRTTTTPIAVRRWRFSPHVFGLPASLQPASMKLRPCAAKPKTLSVTLSVQAKNALCSSQERSLLRSLFKPKTLSVIARSSPSCVTSVQRWPARIGSGRGGGSIGGRCRARVRAWDWMLLVHHEGPSPTG